MKKIVKENLALERIEVSPEEAKKLFEEAGENYKVELVEEHSGKGERITLYRQGEFVDLCAGPHLMSTGAVKAFKLTQCTGAIGGATPPASSWPGSTARRFRRTPSWKNT